MLQDVEVSKILMVLGLVIIVDFVSGVFAARLSPNDEIKRTVMENKMKVQNT